MKRLMGRIGGRVVAENAVGKNEKTKMQSEEKRENDIAVREKDDFTGRKESKKKIDGIVGAIMALDRCIRNQTEPQGCVYDERGLLVL